MKRFLQKAIPKLYGFYFNLLSLFSQDKAASIALKVFSTPRRGRILEHQREFLNSARQQRITSEDGLYMLYHWKGNQKTVMFIHGWDSNTHRWNDLIKDLQKEDYNIIAFDAPAHGNSDGKLLNVPLYSKCLDRVLSLYKPDYIIGHSVGAMTIVYNQYLKKSIFLDKIVLLGSPSDMSRIMKDYQKILKLNPKFMTTLEAYFKQKFGYNFEEFSIAEFSKTIENKTLIIHDQYDRVAPVEAAHAIHQNLKNSSLKITEGAGHSLNKEEIRSAIVKFLNTNP